VSIRISAIALSAAAAVALTGCSLGGTDQASGSDSAQSAQNAATGGDGEDAEASGAKDAGIDPEDPPEAIASTTLHVENDDVDSTKVELVELRRDENVMVATFRLTGQGRGTEETSAFELLGEHTFAPTFVDFTNMEKYTNVTDLTSNDITAEAPLGKPVYVFTAFPLPRQGVDTMDLQLISERPEIVDVPMPE